jgi:hypothetical protein
LSGSDLTSDIAASSRHLFEEQQIDVLDIDRPGVLSELERFLEKTIIYGGMTIDPNRTAL